MSTDDIKFRRFNFKDLTDIEFKTFVKSYEKSEGELCNKMDKTTDKLVKTQQLFAILSKGSEWKILNQGDTLLYLYKDDPIDTTLHKIISFALLKIDSVKKGVTLELLCSHDDKTLVFSKDSKKLGIYLLDYIYDEFVVKEDYILYIEPATPELIRYYTGWKTPSIDVKYLKDTRNYIIYAKIIDVNNIINVIGSYGFEMFENINIKDIFIGVLSFLKSVNISIEKKEKDLKMFLMITK